MQDWFDSSQEVIKINIHMSRYALESPVPPADLIALSPGYRVPLDLATPPMPLRHTRFALPEAATSDRMFENDVAGSVT